MPKISALPIATTAGTGDLLVLDQGLITKSIDFNVLQSAVANAGVVQSLITQSLTSGLGGGNPTFGILNVTGPAIFGSGITVSGDVSGFFTPTRPGLTGLGLSSIANPALYVSGVEALNIILSGAGRGWVGINTIPPSGTLEVGDTGQAAFKLVGLSGQSDQVEIAMVQNQAGLRTYGGFFLIRETNSDLTWTKRTNLNDVECFRVANATGNFGIANAVGGTAPTTFRFNVSRSGAVDFSEIGIYSHTGVIVAGMGVDGVTTNDFRIASIGKLHFYANSALQMGSTPTNESLSMTSTYIQPINTGGYHSSDNSIGMTSNINIGGKVLVIKDGIITGFA